MYNNNNLNVTIAKTFQDKAQSGKKLLNTALAKI